MNERLRLDRIVRTYDQAGQPLEVLKQVSLGISAGEIVALVAPSGAGKSTLLHVAGLLEPPNSGEVWIEGQPCSKLADDQRSRLRRLKLGFIYQFHHLLPEFSALENVMLPQLIAGRSKGEAKQHARRLLESLGLAQRLSHRPARLSGGEQQRVAIARALANGPRILFADEPTGNLDHRTADLVFTELLSLVREHGLAALIATHNSELAARMDRTVTLLDGGLVGI